MSGGQLVVLDRSGGAVKAFPLSRGLATLGSRAPCDIRVMQPAVCAHHATVAVHNSQTVIRNIGDGETLVNGQSVSVAALKHNDIITIGDRCLRWEYSAPNKRHQVSPGLRGLPPRAGAAGARGSRRASAGAAPPPPRDRALQLAIEMSHRASMPASSGERKVAIVQPQRRDNNEQTVPQNTTKATLWIESRKSSPRRRTASPAQAPSTRRTLTPSVAAPTASRRTLTPVSEAPTRRTLTPSVPAPSRRTLTPTVTVPTRRTLTPATAPPARRAISAKKSTPLRLTVLKKAQSATKMRVVKIEAPAKIDHTKQAAIMLMTGHTPRARLSLMQPKKTTPSYVVKKPSPVRKTPGRKGRASGRGSKETGDTITPRRRSAYQETRRSSKRSSGNNSVTVLEITDSDSRSAGGSARPSPRLPSPKKSALKDLSRKGTRKAESIKFDLSNLEGPHDSDVTRFDSEDSMSEDDLTLRYSESSAQSGAPSPSPRKSISSRSGRLLQRAGAGELPDPAPGPAPRPAPRPARRSRRGSLLVQRALNGSDRSADATVASAFLTRTISPRRAAESYSIVDLVSMDSETGPDRSKSIYNSADSADSADFETPNASVRRTRSTIEPTLLGSSTPYAGRAPASAGSARPRSLATPEHAAPAAGPRGPRASRASRRHSRINDSDLLLLDDTELEDSPRSSRRARSQPAAAAAGPGSAAAAGPSTPEQRAAPAEAGTPVLSIQSLLDCSRGAGRSAPRRSRAARRHTVGAPAAASASLGASARRTVLRLSGDSLAPDENSVTPRSSVKLVQEAVKNKHSTAKKPQSKRSIIDDLDSSDIVKQLFNSPVKRKLSQSMTEFSRRQLAEDEELASGARRPQRHTVALAGRSLDDSISDLSGTFTPERFVSPIGTPAHSPNLSGIKRLFRKNTPENDLRNVRGVRGLLRTHRTRRSIKNDLTKVAGVKLVFANSPRNRLSDVRVKEAFKPSPKNDLRRVSGVKSLFQRETSVKNDLSDVRGVKRLFRRSPNNDLRNVSGVKRTLRNTPRNDLTDVRGVGSLFRGAGRRQASPDLSGVEELFDTSTRSVNSEILFDQAFGKPTVRNVYSKTFSASLIRKPKNRPDALHRSLEVIPDNVERWLDRELQARRGARDAARGAGDAARGAGDATAVTKELQNLATATVEGGSPLLASRTRHSSLARRSASEVYGAHTLPLKKRSLAEAEPEPEPAAPRAPRLPLKKRAVVHSTPMKGRVDVTANMNASELGRVSPIHALDNTQSHDTSSNRTRLQKTISEAPSARRGPSLAKTAQKTPKLTPKASRSKATAQASPGPAAATDKRSPRPSPKKVEKSLPKRVTRNRKNTTSENNTKKRRASLVISKKAPVMSPKAGAESGEASQASPVRRAARGRKEQKVETPPKRTRARVQKATVVVPKPSPKLKPQPKGKGASATVEKPTTRKNATANVESPKVSQAKARGKKTESKGKENKTDNVTTEKSKRGRKAADVAAEPPATRRRGKPTGADTGGDSLSKIDKKQPKGRGKKVETVNTSEPTTRRGRKNAENITLATQRETRGKKLESPSENVPKTRGKKVETQSSVQSEPVTRGRRTKVNDNTVIPITAARKRKTAAVEEVPAKVAKTETRRGRKAAEPAPEPPAGKQRAARARATKDKEVDQQGSRTRGGKRTEPEIPAPAKTTRGRKVAEPKDSPVADKRKRKAKAEASPVKGKKPSPSGAKKTRASTKKTGEIAASSGRSRRR